MKFPVDDFLFSKTPLDPTYPEWLREWEHWEKLYNSQLISEQCDCGREDV